MDEPTNNAEQPTPPVPTLFQKAETYLNENSANPSSQEYRDVVATYNLEASKLGEPVWDRGLLSPTPTEDR